VGGDVEQQLPDLEEAIEVGGIAGGLQVVVRHVENRQYDKESVPGHGSSYRIIPDVVVPVQLQVGQRHHAHVHEDPQSLPEKNKNIYFDRFVSIFVVFSHVHTVRIDPH
jgi:hypothetical protein